MTSQSRSQDSKPGEGEEKGAGASRGGRGQPDPVEGEQGGAQLRYQAQLLDNLNDAVVATDERLLIRAWNRAAEGLYGWKVEEVLGQKLVEVIRSELSEVQRAEQLRLLAETGRNRLELAQYRKDGAPVYVETNTIALYGAEGAIAGYVAVNRDITERKRTEEALRAREAQLQTLFEAAPLGIYLIDDGFRIRQVNPVALPTFGDIPELIGRDFEAVMHLLWPPKYAAELVELFRHTLETGEPYFVPERIEMRQDRGVIEYYEWQIHRIPLPEGRYGVVCYFRDVSAQALARQAIAASEDRYRSLFNTIDEGFCVIEMIFDEQERAIDYRFLEVNPAFEKQTGLIKAEGKRVRELIPNPEVYWFEIYGKVALTGIPVRFENPARTLKRWYEVYAYRYGRPEARQVAVLFKDITERKVAEEGLRQAHAALEARVQARTRELYEANAVLRTEIAAREQAEAQLRQMASRLTMAEQEERHRISQVLHDDLQQLLYGIQLKMEFVKDSLESGQGEGLVGHTQEVVTWLQEAITQTRQLTVDLSPPVLQGEGLTDALGWLATQMGELHKLRVDVEAEQVFPIEADMRVLLFQIVRELLFNVVKHAGTERARVRLWEAGGQLVIQVSDKGRGFALEAVEAEGEAGFGLFSIRERLELFGGGVEIVSRPGEGTEVTVRIRMKDEG